MDTEGPLRGRAAWLWTALLISLGVNLFVAGWWAGQAVRPVFDGNVFRRGPEGGPPPGPRVSPFRILTQRLEGKISPDGMRELATIASLIETHFEQRLEMSHERRERAREILGAENFDPELFSKALIDLQTQRTTQDAELVRRIAAGMARLSRADRKILSEVTVPIPPP